MIKEIHHLPGRLRVRMSCVKDHPDLGPVIAHALYAIAGVRGVRVSPVTGSVVVEYNPAQTDTAAIFARLRKHGGCEHRPIERTATRPVHARPVTARKPSPTFGEKLAKAVTIYLVEKAIERSVPLLITALL